MFYTNIVYNLLPSSSLREVEMHGMTWPKYVES